MDNKFKKKLERELDKLNGELSKLNEKKDEIEANIREKTEHKKYVMNKLSNINRMEKQLLKLEEDFNVEYKKEKIIDDSSEEMYENLENNNLENVAEDEQKFDEKAENYNDHSNEFLNNESESYNEDSFEYSSSNNSSFDRNRFNF